MEDTIESMVKKCETKISLVLTSHTSLSSSQTLFVMIRLLGKKHMESIHLRQGRLNELDMIPMEGNEDEEESEEDKENYIVELPANEFPSFKKDAWSCE